MPDINNPSDKANIRAILLAGQATDFWDVLCQVIDINIERQDAQINDEDIMDLDPVEYKTTMEILKGRKRDLIKLKKIPETLILDMEDPDQSQPDLDPYDKTDLEL